MCRFTSPRFSLLEILATVSWALGSVGGVFGAVERGRHEAPAVVGRFIFFRDLAFFGDSERSGFGDTDDDETGLPPLNPLVLRTENRQIFIAKFFFSKKNLAPKFFWRF